MADTIQDNQGNFNTISSQTLQPQPKLAVPVQKPDMTPYTSIIDGALTSLPSVTGQVASAQKTNDDLISKIVGNGSEIANKEVYSQGQQDLQGVKAKQAELDGYNAQFTDLTAQIKGLSRASQAVPLQVQNDNLGTGATDAGVAPQEAGMLRNNAIKALTLASTGDILGAQITNTENRIQRAKDNAQLAVDLKYKPLEAQQAQMKDLLDLNQKYILDPAEAKRVEATRIALDERTRLLEQQKADENKNTDLMINANSQNAPASVIANAKAIIANGGKPDAVANALGVYAGDYIGNQAKEASIKSSLASARNSDLNYLISKYQYNQMVAPPIGQNQDGTVVKGTGGSSQDRNVNTVEQLIKQKGKQIPDGTQTLVGNGLAVLDTIKQFATANPDGKFEGFYPVASGLVPDALKSEQRVKNESLANAINLPLQKWASGASLTPEQTKLVMQMVPTSSDTDANVRTKLNTLANMMNGQISSDLTSAGVKYRPENIDYFDKGIATRVKNAIGTGYSPTEVVDGLVNDPVYGPKIAQARQANWKDDKIATYLQSIPPEPEKPEFNGRYVEESQ